MDRWRLFVIDDSLAVVVVVVVVIVDFFVACFADFDAAV